MAIRAFFPTLIYRQRKLVPPSGRFNRALLDECRSLAASDESGRRWSARNYHGGYTSYGSHDRIHALSPVFAELRRLIDPHVRRFARKLQFDLGRDRLVMTDCWLNVMKAGVVHSMHLHPASVVSGTYYVAVPRGAAALKFEDPRLSRLMAAPPRRPDAPAALRPHVSVPSRAGDLILFESWLRHEVPAAGFEGERISISFNYGRTGKRRA